MRSTIALVGLALVAAGLPSAAPAQAAETCQEKLVTISDSDGGKVEGTDGDDVILMSGGHNPGEVIAKGGNDTICLEDGRVRGGPGRDSVFVGGEVEFPDLEIRDVEDLDVTVQRGVVRLIHVRGGEGTLDIGGAGLLVIGRNRITVDLEDDLVEVDGGTYSVLGTPSVFAGARQVHLEGDSGSNELAAEPRGCSVVIEGGRGDDHLELYGITYKLPSMRGCHRQRPRLLGQRGDDILQGRRTDDVLVGGPGSDKAYGAEGTDTCRAEIERKCER